MKIETAAQILFLAANRLRAANGFLAGLDDHQLVNLSTTAGAVRGLTAALDQAGAAVLASMQPAVEVPCVHDGKSTP